jgi:hypothetical protein
MKISLLSGICGYKIGVRSFPALRREAVAEKVIKRTLWLKATCPESRCENQLGATGGQPSLRNLIVSKAAFATANSVRSS